jgi:hypothetical protein
MLHESSYFPWHRVGHLCELFSPQRIFLGMRLDYVAQVDEIVGAAELGESDILHCFVDFSSMFLSGSSVRLQNKLCSVVGRIFPAIGIEIV